MGSRTPRISDFVRSCGPLALEGHRRGTSSASSERGSARSDYSGQQERTGQQPWCSARNVKRGLALLTTSSLEWASRFTASFASAISVVGSPSSPAQSRDLRRSSRPLASGTVSGARFDASGGRHGRDIPAHAVVDTTSVRAKIQGGVLSLSAPDNLACRKSWITILSRSLES